MKKPTVGAVGQEFMSSPIVGDASHASCRVLDSDRLSIRNNNSNQHRPHSRQSQKTNPNTNGAGEARRQIRRSSVFGTGRPGVLSRSGRNRPCAICGRRIDGKCVWGSNFIHCYPGDTHHPPAHLQVGDRIDAEGITWALVAKDGGWSRSHWVFRPHRPINPGQQPPQQQKSKRPVNRRLAHKINRLSKGISLAIADAVDALAVNETQLHLLTAPELQARFELIHDQPRSLRVMLKALRQDELEWGRAISELEGLLVAVLRHESMVKRFRRDCLGEEV
jgi:hypothetical protein